MADLVRVSTVAAGTGFATHSIPPGTAIEVVIDVEAESAEFAAGARFAVGACAMNRTTGVVTGPLVPAAGSPAYGVNANMGAGTDWSPEDDQFRYTIPGAFGAANDIIEVYGFLKVGAGARVETHFASASVIRG